MAHYRLGVEAFRIVGVNRLQDDATYIQLDDGRMTLLLPGVKVEYGDYFLTTSGPIPTTLVMTPADFHRRYRVGVPISIDAQQE